MTSSKFKYYHISDYISICSNPQENILHSKDEFLFFAKSHCPIVYDVKQKRVILTLLGHKGYVTGLKLIEEYEKTEQGTYKLISISQDKTAIIWKITLSQQTSSYKILYILNSQDNDWFLTALCSERKGYNDSSEFLSFTSTIDGNLNLWKNGQLILSQKCSYYALDSKILKVRFDEYIDVNLIILAGSDDKVHIYYIDGSDKELKLVSMVELAGHTGWVKSLDIIEIRSIENKSVEYLLGSASQDGFVRVWFLKVILTQDQTCFGLTRIVASNPIKLDNDSTFLVTATLETVLSGHENAVCGLKWFKNNNLISLVTCSFDKTIILWQATINEKRQDSNTSLLEQESATQKKWTQAIRLGERGELNLPFLNISLSEDKRYIYAMSLHGAIHCWKMITDNVWQSEQFLTGHFEQVTDLAWDKFGLYLLSVSTDKTCRLHAPVGDDRQWREIYRPQVHGYEINCIASVSLGKFVSGSDEKTLRCFDATQFFYNSWLCLACEETGKVKELLACDEDRPRHAQLPALGLSTKPSSILHESGDEKAVGGDATDNWNSRSELYQSLNFMEGLQRMPVEEVLLNSTLWFESKKLFGHVNEIFAIGCDTEGEYLASSSKANKPELATIFVWNTEKFRKVATLSHHSLTVTRLRFSPNGKYLLSVSRDRTWCLFKKVIGVRKGCFNKFFGTEKSSTHHERIIWDCCWTDDSKYFMTVSRDKQVLLWCLESIEKMVSDNVDSSLLTKNDLAQCVTRKLLFEESIQAVDCCRSEEDSYLFAFGLENGTMHLYECKTTDNHEMHLVLSIPNLHHITIRRLLFKPQTLDAKENNLILASGGDDGIVKLTKLLKERL